MTRARRAKTTSGRKIPTANGQHPENNPVSKAGRRVRRPQPYSLSHIFEAQRTTQVVQAKGKFDGQRRGIVGTSIFDPGHSPAS
jgi:hypothetical protein